ncbi:PREDICTED: bromodomain-containing protein 8-like isoform X2 [Crocodylus porosus]|uniref:bromodomain-containing protein 8-like isoform X2 n=1 Tax=Crocodylus porosus TaxID=8502 RepID=UPI00093BBC8A|nr:PREDICTED: bromodomain-containing protein 8-like isoform X2 [Crocodylus porosus]
MGHTWMWLDSERESLSESEKSSCCQSLHSSWDSSLDLEVTDLMEPLCIRGSDPAQMDRAFCTAREQEEMEALNCQEEMERLPVPRREAEEEGQPRILAGEAEKLPVLGRGMCMPQMTRDLQHVGREAKDAKETRDVGEDTGESQVPGGEEGDSGEERECLVVVENAEGIQEGEKNQKLLMNPTSLGMPTLEEELSGSMKSKAEEAPGQAQQERQGNTVFPAQGDSGCRTSVDFPDVIHMNPAPLQLVKLSWDDPLQRMHFKKTLLSIWKMIASHRPMDLTTIKRSLSKGNIRSTAQFQRDLMLMFHNAVMYNSADHHVHHMAVEMQQEVLEQLQMLGEALLCSQDRLRFERC